jgi:cytidylate kinase
VSSVDARTPFVIALDGPAASGKSSVGMQVAEALGFFYFDTGLLYRALTWVALRRGLDLADGPGLAAAATSTRFVARPPSVDDGRQADVLADGVDITWDVRRPEVDANVSRVAAHAEVRDALLQPQRDAVCPPGTILAGRDIGTVIAPDAPLKLWLTASVEERARRRAAQTGEDVEAVRARMAERDALDSTRAVAPMVMAGEAVELNTDGLSQPEVVARVIALARERGA